MLSGIVWIFLSSHCFSEVQSEYAAVISEYFFALENNDVEKYGLVNSSQRLRMLKNIGLETALSFEREALPKVVSMKISNVKLSSVFVEVRGVVGDNYVPEGIVRVNKANYVGIFELKIDSIQDAGDIRVQSYSYGVSSFIREDSLGRKR